jgi:hypothetical protein
MNYKAIFITSAITSAFSAIIFLAVYGAAKLFERIFL